MTKIYTKIVNFCGECPDIYRITYGYKCRKTYRDIYHNSIIQEWCPLLDVEDNFICGMSAEECSKCDIYCLEKEIKLLLK